MVRGIAGTLKQIGEGRRSSDEMRIILESGDCEAVGPRFPRVGFANPGLCDVSPLGYSSSVPPRVTLMLYLFWRWEWALLAWPDFG